MDPIITSLSSSTDAPHGENDCQSPTYRYRKINVALAYPSEAIKEQFSSSKEYVYPPLMSPSDEFFQHQQTPPPTSQPINIPQGRSKVDQHGRQGQLGRRNSVPVRPSSSLPTTTAITTTTVTTEDTSTLPSPPMSPWKRMHGFTRPTRSKTMVVDETPFPDLPRDVRSWTSSQVAEYIGYSLRVYPRAITEDLGRYVRQSVHMTGAKFLDLKKEDLERMEINLKWRSMIMKAVGMLRRETLRASRIDEVNWEDGYDADKDGPLPSPPHNSTDDDLSASAHHSTSASSETDPTLSQEHGLPSSDTGIHNDLVVSTETAVPEQQQQEADVQEPNRGVVENITGVLLSWKREQEERVKRTTVFPTNGLGFTEGVVVGGLIVACMMRFTR